MVPTDVPYDGTRAVRRDRGRGLRLGTGGRRVVELRDVALGVEGGRTARAGGGDRLPVVVVDEVAAGEHAREVGGRRRVRHECVALVVEVDLALDQLRAR